MSWVFCMLGVRVLSRRDLPRLWLDQGIWPSGGWPSSPLTLTGSWLSRCFASLQDLALGALDGEFGGGGGRPNSKGRRTGVMCSRSVRMMGLGLALLGWREFSSRSQGGCRSGAGHVGWGPSGLGAPFCGSIGLAGANWGDSLLVAAILARGLAWWDVHMLGSGRDLCLSPCLPCCVGLRGLLGLDGVGLAVCVPARICRSGSWWAGSWLGLAFRWFGSLASSGVMLLGGLAVLVIGSSGGSGLLVMAGFGSCGFGLWG